MRCTGFCRGCGEEIDRGSQGNRLRCGPCAADAARRQRNAWGRENRLRINARRRKKIPYTGAETTNHGDQT